MGQLGLSVCIGVLVTGCVPWASAFEPDAVFSIQRALGNEGWVDSRRIADVTGELTILSATGLSSREVRLVDLARELRKTTLAADPRAAPREGWTETAPLYEDVGFGSTAFAPLNAAFGWPFCDVSSSWIENPKAGLVPPLASVEVVPSTPGTSVCDGFFGPPGLFSDLRLETAGAERWGARAVSWWIRDGEGAGSGRGTQSGDYDSAVHNGAGVLFDFRSPWRSYRLVGFLGASATTAIE